MVLHLKMIARLVDAGMTEEKAINLVAQAYCMDVKYLTLAFKKAREELGYA